MIVSIDRMMQQNGWTQGCFFQQKDVSHGTANAVNDYRKDKDT
jgi:hypothetical protein